MNLRCKPGDLAITENMPMDNGLIVEVKHAVDAQFFGRDYLGHCWEVKSLGSEFHMTPTERSATAWIPDANLRPIGKPGDEAVDEMVKLCPLPLPEIVPAMLDREVEHG